MYTDICTKDFNLVMMTTWENTPKIDDIIAQCIPMSSDPHPEKHQKFTQSKFDIFFLHKPCLAFKKEIAGKMKTFAHIWIFLHKNGLQVCVFFQVWH